MAMAMSVTGPIDPENLGITMCHVHVLSELKVAEQAKPQDKMTAEELRLLHHPVTTEMLGVIRRHVNDVCALDNNLLGDVELAIAELDGYKKAGGSTIVETSVVGLKRDPANLQRISRATGLKESRSGQRAVGIGADFGDSVLAGFVGLRIDLGGGDGRDRCGKGEREELDVFHWTSWSLFLATIP
jgi:hypothetical protein